MVRSIRQNFDGLATCSNVDLGWLSVFISIGVLLLPTTNWLHKFHHQNLCRHFDCWAAVLLMSSLKKTAQLKRRAFDDEVCEANLWLVERELHSTGSNVQQTLWAEPQKPPYHSGMYSQAIFPVVVENTFYFFRNKSDISCLKNQPDAVPVQYTQLSLGQSINLQL